MSTNVFGVPIYRHKCLSNLKNPKRKSKDIGSKNNLKNKEHGLFAISISKSVFTFTKLYSDKTEWTQCLIGLL